MVIEQWNGDLIERKVLERVDEAVRERALVGLYGPGGCGKSVLMWQLLRRLQAIGCCTVRHASNLQRSWVVDAVQAWRNLSRSNDTAEEAIERLQIANPGQRPILWLGLDGLDEGARSADRETHIREILQWFWERDCRRGSSSPVATLVVSCRNQEDLHEVWLNLPLPRFYSGELPLTVPIGDFTEDEILKAAQKKLPELYPRIRDSIHAGSGVQSALVERDHDTAVFGHPSPDTSSGPVDGRVLKSLEHPAMWLALLNLEPLDQRNAVQGKKQSVYDLAHRFIIWFHSKLKYRERERFQNLTESDLVQVLGAIVQHSSETAPYSRDSDWSKPAWQTGQVSEAEANDLYREALSAGLIIEDARHLWRWRHFIVRDYLAST
jgi:energy-coupling factor transporter ATP-binding protein EcfA2